MSKLQLKNITILSLNCVDPIQSAKALLYSSKDIDFAEMILVSNKKPDRLPSEIKFIPTDVLTHKDGSRFTYTQLPNFVRTEYCLTIHDDGFVINSHLWTDEFLNMTTLPETVSVHEGQYQMFQNKVKLLDTIRI
jgi:hypothetical protein